MPFDEAALFKAVELAKTDLTTELVKEFTELQGVIGGLYARAQGLGETVAQAIYDQYTPASIEDPIPSTVEGQLLGIADRIQTIVAMFGIGNAPTGSKDPFALRRAANAIVKILAESELPLTLSDVVDAIGVSDARQSAGRRVFPRAAAVLSERRARVCVRRGERGAGGGRGRCARRDCARRGADFGARVGRFRRRFGRVQAHQEHPAAGRGKGLSVPMRRRSASSQANSPSKAIDLWDRSKELAPQIAKLREQRNYGEALALIATLRPTMDQFFDKVMVLDPDEAVRGANLGLIDRGAAQLLRRSRTSARL